MLSEELHTADMHLSDQEMLLAADGELSSRGRSSSQPTSPSAGFAAPGWQKSKGQLPISRELTGRLSIPKLPPIAGPRALLRAQLAELVSKREASCAPVVPPAHARGMRAAAFISAAVLIAAVVGRILVHHSTLRGANSIVAAFERGALPDRSLTPGATRRVAISDVCSMAHEEVVGEVSTSLRQEVFREYGILNAHQDDYEVDYLIAPGLGGVEDIHNLWPEPYTSRTWNAHIKDSLGGTPPRIGLRRSTRFAHGTARHRH